MHPAYNENTGTVLLEALVAGLPVITTDACRYACYVNEASAGIVLSSPFNQSVLNQQLETALVSSAREQWQWNALAFSKQADIYDLTTKAVDFIEALNR